MSSKKRRLMIGEVFNRWKVLEEVNSKRTIGRKREYVQRMFRCKCECGGEGIVSYSNLVTLDSKSCGCLQKEKASLTFSKLVKTGCNNGNWRGGIANRNKMRLNKKRNTIGYRKWRKTIIERDKVCKRCEGVNRLQAHHIENFDQSTDEHNIDNGICLCYTCHRTFHKQYGFTKNTKEQMKEFIEKYSK